MRRHLLETSEGMVAAAAATPSTAASPKSDSELTRASFDTNMVIILAALLCALICAMGLNSVVRCVLRCSQSEESAARTGLKKSVLRKIPIFVYGSDRDMSGSRIKSGSECPICLGEFVDGEKVRVLPRCNHGFHVRCIDTWLGSHSSCPNCRHSLLDVPIGSSKAVGVAVRSNDTGDMAMVAVEPPQEGSGGGGGGEGHVVVEMNEGT